MSRRNLSIAISLSLLTAACSGGGSSSSSSTSSSSSSSSSSSGGMDAGVQLGVQSYTSAAAGFAVNSHLVTGPGEALLVDGQILKADAQAVIAMVQASGKTLTTVLLTHAHPDHYLGMGLIQAAFPNARFVTTAAVLADFQASAAGTAAYLKMAYGDAVDDHLAALTALQSDQLLVDGAAITVVDVAHAGESAHGAALVLPNGHGVITGDQVYGRAHLFLAECRTDGWLTNLDQIQALGGTSIYPGHGETAGSILLDEDRQYIHDVKAILDGAATVDAAKTAIQQAYPTYSGAGLLDFSAQTYFQACKPQPDAGH